MASEAFHIQYAIKLSFKLKKKVYLKKNVKQRMVQAAFRWDKNCEGGTRIEVRGKNTEGDHHETSHRSENPNMD